MNHSNPYRQLLTDPSLLHKVGTISQRFLTTFQMFSKYFLEKMEHNHFDPLYEKTLDTIFKNLTYRKIHNEGPMCAKKITKFYRCHDCQKKNGNQHQACICQDCFAAGDHSGHNFRLIESLLAGCDCGDQELMEKTSFCGIHRKPYRALNLSQSFKENRQIFIQEMSFLFDIFLEVAPIKKNVLDEHRMKEIFGLTLISKIATFIDKSYTNKLIVADFLQFQTQRGTPSKNMLQKILAVEKFDTFLDKFCEYLLISLSSVPKVKQIVVSYIFHSTASKESCLRPNHPITRIAFQYLSSGQTVYQLLSKGIIPCLTINYPYFKNLQEKSQTYTALYRNYRYLLKSKSAEAILTYMLENMSICSLYNYMTPQELKQNRSLCFALDESYFNFLVALLKKLHKFTAKKRIERKMIKQAYLDIMLQKDSISLSASRTFALALFGYLNFSNSAIDNLSDGQILDLLGETDEQIMAQNLSDMLDKYLYLLKVDNFTEYKKQIFKESELAGYSRINLSADYIYIRQLLMILYKIHRPHYGSPLEPIISFIYVRQDNLKKLLTMFEEDQTSRIEEVIAFLMYQINLLIVTFLFAGESTLCELIVSEYFGGVQQSEVFDIYRLLVYINPELSPVEFKRAAEKYLKNSKLIEKFIKEELSVCKQTLKNGEIPENRFNLSYNSFLLKPQGFNQSNNLYYLKRRSNKRTQLSTQLFNSHTISVTLRLYKWFLEIYARCFRENKTKATTSVILAIFETLVILNLQAQDQDITQMIELMRQNEYVCLNSDPYSSQIVSMYSRNECRIQREDNAGLWGVPPKRSEALQIKKMQKIKQLKITQNKVINRINSMSEPEKLPKTEDAQQNLISCKQKCIVCNAQSSVPLAYLCQFRCSNLMSANLFDKNYPILLITTCGHPIHIQCLQSGVRVPSTDIFEGECLLCKNLADFFIQIRESPTVNEAEHCFQVIQLLEDELKRDERIIRELYEGEYINTSIEGRLIVSLVYQLYGYTLHYPKFFYQRIFPTFTMLFRFLKIKKPSPEVLSYAEAYFSTHQNQILNFTNKAFALLLQDQDIESVHKLAEKLLEQMGSHSLREEAIIEQHMEILIQILESMLQPYSSAFLEKIRGLKIFQEPRKMYQLPQDLTDLNRQVGLCPNCKRYTSKIMICFICSFKICESCREMVFKHAMQHYGQSAYIKVETGDCYYQWDKYSIFTSSLYLNYIGEPLASAETFPEKGCYQLNKEKKDAMVDDILSMRIQFKVLDKMEGSRCDVQ